MSTWCGQKRNHRFNQFRKQEVQEDRGPTTTYHAVKTSDDETSKMSKTVPYKLKGNLVSNLLKEGYQQIDPDTFIGRDDFAIIYKECWR